MILTPDQARLAWDEATPAMLRLSRVLGRLRSTLTFMNTGAHPDDEHSGLLAWLRFGRGMRVAIASSTRGEGGQNALGPERGDALGLIRTAEMQDAARVLDAHLLWLGFGTADPVHDFGFSKDGEDSLRRWQGDLVVRRLAGGYRMMRPDIVLPTFLDVPGQHGHHRAMTRAAEQALALAADPGADLGDVAGADRPVWKVPKFYLPAWSGGGGTYDDEVPPPDATVTVRAAPRDPVSGAPYDRIGEWSRRRHASQGMGDWPDPPRQSWALHRIDSVTEGDIADGLPDSLADLAAVCPDLPMLATAAQEIDTALAAFPDAAAIIQPLLRAHDALRHAKSVIGPQTAARHGHRIANKRHEIALALAEAAGLRASLRCDPPHVAAGGQADVVATIEHPADIHISRIEYHVPKGVSVRDGVIEVAPKAAVTPRYDALWSPAREQSRLHAMVSFELRDQCFTVPVGAIPDLRILPAEVLHLDPPSLLLVPSRRRAALTIAPEGAVLPAPQGGFEMSWHGSTIAVDWPEGAAPTRQQLRAMDPSGAPGFTSQPVPLPAGGEERLVAPAIVTLLAVDTATPKGRIGVIEGMDRSAYWLTALGADIERIDPVDTGVLARYDSVVLGVMAMARGDIAPGVLRDYVEGGGNLLSFYQRPDRGWDADHSGPARLRVGTPSLRWRVTDPDAPVRVLEPDHSLLNAPNRIGADDWQGWVKDRGLYFAADWDPAYRPILSMSDRGEAPLTGALISARLGQGRHTHCALSLPQQMDGLVPGAFRLMVNLIAPVA